MLKTYKWKTTMYASVEMSDPFVYIGIGILTFIIGFLLGNLATDAYYRRRFIAVAEDCSKEDSLVPLIAELERES